MYKNSLLNTDKVVIFSPHPDDAELGCGGLIQKRAKLKRNTYIAYLTDGSNSHYINFKIKSEPSQSELKIMRKQEVIDAQQVLGNDTDRLQFFNYVDGLLYFEKKNVISKIVNYLHSIKPEIVLVPYKYDKHPDHMSTYKVVEKAIKSINFNIFIYQYFSHGINHIIQASEKGLFRLDIHDELNNKQVAISKFNTQINCISKRQLLPVLTPDFLKNFDVSYELYLCNDDSKVKPFAALQRKISVMLLTCWYGYYLKYNL